MAVAANRFQLARTIDEERVCVLFPFMEIHPTMRINNTFLGSTPRSAPIGRSVQAIAPSLC